MVEVGFAVLVAVEEGGFGIVEAVARAEVVE